MPQEIGNETHYTVEEVSICANEAYHTSLRKVNDGAIESVTVTRQKLIPHKALVEYLESLNLPESIIDYRLGLKSPKNGNNIEATTA